MQSFPELFEIIGVLARRRYQCAERQFAKLGLNHSEARVLILLAQEKGTATQDTLSNLLFVDRSNAGRALKNLEQGGHIIRKKDKTDKRTNMVHLTALGKDTLVEIRQLKQGIIDGFFGTLSEPEAGQIVELMKKVMTTAEQEAVIKEDRGSC